MSLSRVCSVAAAVTIAGLALSACGAAGDTDIDVSDVRVPEPAGANGAVYLTLTNNGSDPDQLVGVRTDAAESAQLHASTMVDGAMSMDQADRVEIPAGGEATLEPGGLHVMLIDVSKELTDGDTVELTLTFEHAEAQMVRAEVVPLGGMGE